MAALYTSSIYLSIPRVDRNFFSAFSSVPRCREEEEEKKAERPFHLEGTYLLVRVQKNEEEYQEIVLFKRSPRNQ